MVNYMVNYMFPKKLTSNYTLINVFMKNYFRFPRT